MLILTNWVLKQSFFKILSDLTCYWAGQNWEFHTMCNSCWIFRNPHYVHHHFFPTGTFGQQIKIIDEERSKSQENLVLPDSDLQVCMWRWSGTVQNCKGASDRRCSRLTWNLKIHLHTGLFRIKSSHESEMNGFSQGIITLCLPLLTEHV